MKISLKSLVSWWVCVNGEVVSWRRSFPRRRRRPAGWLRLHFWVCSLSFVYINRHIRSCLIDCWDAFWSAPPWIRRASFPPLVCRKSSSNCRPALSKYHYPLTWLSISSFLFWVGRNLRVSGRSWISVPILLRLVGWSSSTFITAVGWSTLKRSVAKERRRVTSRWWTTNGREGIWSISAIWGAVVVLKLHWNIARVPAPVHRSRF